MTASSVAAASATARTLSRVEVVVDEDRDRDERADRRDGEERLSLRLDVAAAPLVPTQAADAISSSAAGQRMSIQVPSTYVPAALWKR